MTANQVSDGRKSLLRKRLLMPTEHGSWSWLLVPFAVGAAVGGRFDLPVLLALLAGLSAFFMRQPATVWLRTRRGRARRSDGPVAAVWTAFFGSVSLLSLIGLLALGMGDLLWLLLPLAVIFVTYLLASQRGGAGLRNLWMELTGAAALALMAPVAFIAAGGSITAAVWLLWMLLAFQNVLGALYVRLRIYDTRAAPIHRAAIGYAHIGALVTVLCLAFLTELPLLASLPFAAFLGRCVWAITTPRPIRNIKRFGFTEMGVEILSGAWMVLAYSL